MSIAFFRDVFLHMEWADATMWSAVFRFESAKSDDYVLRTLHHVHETQHAFLEAWLSGSFTRRKLEDFDGPSALATWGKEFHHSVRSFTNGLAGGMLKEERILPWAKYMTQTLGQEPAPTTVRDTLQQLSSHSMHHRGQVAGRLRELGHIPPMTDYIVWIWGGRPAVSWPVVG
jgi:uncharacterized damage-inducible protein DinB